MARSWLLSHLLLALLIEDGASEVLDFHPVRGAGQVYPVSLWMIDGTVQALSRDAVLEGGDRKDTDRRLPDEGGDEPVVKPASYMARIALDRNWIDTEAGRMTLGAGMSVTAEIYTGKRRIIGFLLSPLQRVVGESGHER